MYVVMQTKQHGEMELLPIHRYPQYLEDTCTMMNQEWARSRTARMRSLESSCDNFPTRLILVSDGEVLGHSKLTPLHHLPGACLIESVVIHKEKRGRGLGRLLMEKTEEYAKSHGMETMYLTTHGKEGFYSKLGYKVCRPIQIYGSRCYSSCGTTMQTKATAAVDSGSDTLPASHNLTSADDALSSSSSDPSESGSIPPPFPLPPPPLPPPPPPPPPPPQPGTPEGQAPKSSWLSVVHMKKDLAQ